MPVSQHFFVEGRYLGARQIDGFKRGSFGLVKTETWVYFCPRCGDIWARLLVDGAVNSQILRERCPKHGGSGQLAQECRFEWWETEFDSNWPSAAIRYEFERTLDQAMKG